MKFTTAIFRFILFVCLSFLSAKGIAQLQERKVIQLYDYDSTICFERVIDKNYEDTSKGYYRFFSRTKEPFPIQVFFDEKNLSIRSFEDLMKLYKREIDSTTFIVCYLVADSSMNYQEQIFLYIKDLSCLAEYRRRIKLDKALHTYLNKRFNLANHSEPFVYIKEWKCSTTSLWSTFGD